MLDVRNSSSMKTLHIASWLITSCGAPTNGSHHHQFPLQMWFLCQWLDQNITWELYTITETLPQRREVEELQKTRRHETLDAKFSSRRRDTRDWGTWQSTSATIAHCSVYLRSGNDLLSNDMIRQSICLFGNFPSLLSHILWIKTYSLLVQKKDCDVWNFWKIKH